VSIEGTSRSVTTDAMGRFRLTGAPEGTASCDSRDRASTPGSGSTVWWTARS
jgi:hypothetical protein